MIDRRGRRTAPVATLLVLLGAGLLAACDAPGPSVPTTSTTGPTTGPLTIPPASPSPPALTPAPVTPAPTVPAAVTPPCTAADLKASHGFVEGAAGSRLTQIVLVSAIACSIDAFPVLGFRDASGAALIGGVAGGSGRIDLSPQSSYVSDVRISNFCADAPSFPVELEIRLGSEEVAVGGPAFDDSSDLPPCNGAGATTLEAGGWSVQP